MVKPRSNPSHLPPQMNNQLYGSNIQSPELPMLPELLKLNQPALGIDLDGLFNIQIVNDSTQQNVQNVSVMNSSLYRNNMRRFMQEQIKLQDKIKLSIRQSQTDLAEGYKSAVGCKKMMIDLLNS